MEFRTKNPVLTRVDSATGIESRSYIAGRTASFSGIAVKSGILLAIIFAISIVIWTNLQTLAPFLWPMMIMGMVVGFISVMVASFSRSAAPVFTIIYAVCEGLVLGTLSAIVNIGIPGIVANAVLITFAIFGFLLIAYATGIFKVGFTFRKIYMTALVIILVVYLFSWIFSLFNITFLRVSPGLLLVIALIMVIMASFSLLIDFDDCKRAVDGGVPASYEWYLSLGLLVSLVWLYTEVLRLLIIIASHLKD